MKAEKPKIELTVIKEDMGYGIKKPSASQTKRILQGVQQIGKELSEARFLM